MLNSHSTQKDYLCAFNIFAEGGYELKEYLIVDEYNVINGWDELRAESVHSLEVSRQKLLDIMSDYQGYRDINGARTGSGKTPGTRADIGNCCDEEAMNEMYINKLENKRNLLENDIYLKIRSTLEKWRRENTKT